MLDPLRAQFKVSWIEAIGTDPRYPPTEGWPRLVDQLIESITEPVCGVGHPLGGYLNYLAAVRRPELFCAIVLLDAPIIGPFRGSMLGATKRLGIVDRVTPAGATRDRRSTWQTREEARAHFRSRKLFKHFTSECLDDYVNYGLMESEGGLRLKIDPLIEYQIYRTIPHDMMRTCARCECRRRSSAAPIRTWCGACASPACARSSGCARCPAGISSPSSIRARRLRRSPGCWMSSQLLLEQLDVHFHAEQVWIHLEREPVPGEGVLPVLALEVDLAHP
jgi:hypothetical protein